MAINHAKLFNRRVTPQSQPIPGSTQVRNSAGGYSWQADDWTRFDLFLILGAEDGTYYIAERDLVKQNHDALVRCIQADGVRAVNRIVEISHSGRAPKNDPAIFALALVTAHGNSEAKAVAFQNLGKMTAIGLIKPFSDAKKLVLRKLKDETALKRSRIHPLAVLVAQKIYAQGHGEKGALKWSPVSAVVDALDATFSNVEPCNKPVLLALDVSGSMACTNIAGSCLTAREASAAMALVTAATEPDCEIIAFSAPAGGGYGGMHGGGESGITRVALSPRLRLDDVIKRISAIPMGGTDCALPMVWARRQKLNVSGFITYTDSETWAGHIHPSQALRLYRDEFVPDAKAVVVGMTSNGFTLADPNDRGMLDVVGFDTSVPAVIADFIRQ